jgi:hypothetical protein
MARAKRADMGGSTPPAICQAIREHRRLTFDYGGLPREVEPYCHGVSSAAKEVLRAVQVGGASGSGGFGFGKLWEVAKMSRVQLGAPFTPHDPSYNPDDRAMAEIHCRVAQT